MRLVTFYHRETGLFHDVQLMVSDDGSVAPNTPEDHIAIDGYHDRLSKRFDIPSGAIVDYQPPQPSTEHEWDEDTKRWRLNAEASGRMQRRSAALARIAHLEASVQPRAQRELILKIANRLGIDGEQSQNIDDEIAGLRKHLEG